MNEIYGYSLCRDVRDPVIRAHNRVVIVKNIQENHGQNAAKDYLEELSETDKAQMVLAYKAKKGMTDQEYYQMMAKRAGTDE